MIRRDLELELPEFAKFPVVVVVGPRQSGKTTLAQKFFTNHKYFSFEDEQIRDFAQNDPKRFLSSNENEYGLILDEFQHVPKILSFIQLEVDAKKRPGYFVLTGSQNFLMNQSITQSLAGRVGILNLLPLSLHELDEHKLLSQDVDTIIYSGFYPRIYDQGLQVDKFYSSYMQSYVERDVRQLVNVVDLSLFQKFMALCAGRVGQLLNLQSLANDCGITLKTVKRWLSILEASYVIFLLQPYHNHFNKRITKSAKLYFYDTGLASYLLRIPSKEGIAFHALRGSLFECLIIADLYKQYCNVAQRSPLYFWRDQNGLLEVDCIIDQGIALTPIEIKSGETINSNYVKNLVAWSNLAQQDPAHGYVIYGGQTAQSRSTGNIIGWRACQTLATTMKQELAMTMRNPKSI